MRGLSEREKRTVGLGVAAAALILGVRFLPPLVSGADETGLHEKRELLSRTWAVAARGEETKRAWTEALDRRESLRRHLLSETNPNLAGASLSSVVEEVARSSHLEVLRVQILPADTVGEALQRIPVTVTARGDVHGLFALLSTLAGHEPTLVVETLRISVDDDPRAIPGGEPSLAVQARVAGFAGLSQGPLAPPEAGDATGPGGTS